MTLNIALAQLNFTVADIKLNTAKIVAAVAEAKQQQADIVVFPELCITGYPPEDLLFRADFIQQAALAVQEIAAQVQGIDVLIGYPKQQHEQLYNCAVVCRNGEIIAEYHKNALPNYGVFDEQRYFAAGNSTTIFQLKNSRLALTICEDIWQAGIIEKNRQAGADIILTLNASPFHAGKIHQREEVIGQQLRSAGIPLVYVNQVGGQDELIFDGASFVADSQGQMVFRAPEFTEHLAVVEFINHQPVSQSIATHYQPVISEYKALVLGIRDYVQKNGFQGAILGLSGGIDSLARHRRGESSLSSPGENLPPILRARTVRHGGGHGNRGARVDNPACHRAFRRTGLPGGNVSGPDQARVWRIGRVPVSQPEISPRRRTIDRHGHRPSGNFHAAAGRHDQDFDFRDRLPDKHCDSGVAAWQPSPSTALRAMAGGAGGNRRCHTKHSVWRCIGKQAIPLSKHQCVQFWLLRC